MAFCSKSVLLTTLVLASGHVLAGDHDHDHVGFGPLCEDAPLIERQLHGAGIIPADSLSYRLTDQQIEALNEDQKNLLIMFERRAYEGELAPQVCLHPDTPKEVASAFNDFLNDLWFTPTPNSFILNTRWSRTATDGSGLSQGDATTLTYSFVPDGTNIVGEGSSNLFSFMDSNIGSGTWESRIQTALDAWSDVSGLEYVREFNDDGANLSGSGNNGILGVRGDVRISGNFIDGGSGVLAYNYFPNGGDMVIDTGDTGFYSNSSNSHIRLRNVITHEAGHGIGLSHVESDSNRFLMEPFIDISFTGPQIDDIRGAQRGYGDEDEDNNGFGSATDFNAVAIGGGAPFVGGDFPSINLRSMDDNTDTDYYAIETGEPVTMTVLLSPTGGSYQFTAQGGGGGGSFFNATARADLEFTVTDITTSTLINVDNSGLGQGEVALLELPTPGIYYLIVDGSNVNEVQTYNIGLSFTTLEVETCPADLNGDGTLDFFDVSAFLTEFGNQTAAADFTGDGSWDFFDVSAFLTEFGMGCP